MDTRIVSISVTDRAPEEASRIANSLRLRTAQKIISVIAFPDVTTRRKHALTSPSSPNDDTMVWIPCGGGCDGCHSSPLVEILDTRVKRPEDIEDVLQICTIGSSSKFG